MGALRFKQDGDVMGVCPNCGNRVPVYANGNALRMRPHGATLMASPNARGANRKVACPVQGVDARPALKLAMAAYTNAIAKLRGEAAAYRVAAGALVARTHAHVGAATSPPRMAPRKPAAKGSA